MQRWAKTPTREEMIEGQMNLETNQGSNEEHKSKHKRKVDDQREAESQNQTLANPDKPANWDARRFEQVDLTDSDKPTRMRYDSDNYLNMAKSRL